MTYLTFWGKRTFWYWANMNIAIYLLSHQRMNAIICYIVIKYSAFKLLPSKIGKIVGSTSSSI